MDPVLSSQQDSRTVGMGRTAGIRQLLATAATCQRYLPFLPSSCPAQHRPASASAPFPHPVVSSSCHPLLWPAPSRQRTSYQLRLWYQQHPTASKGNGMEKGGEGMGTDFLSCHVLHSLVGNTAESTRGSPGNTETEEFTWLHTNILRGGVCFRTTKDSPSEQNRQYSRRDLL